MDSYNSWVGAWWANPDIWEYMLSLSQLEPTVNRPVEQAAFTDLLRQSRLVVALRTYGQANNA